MRQMSGLDDISATTPQQSAAEEINKIFTVTGQQLGTIVVELDRGYLPGLTADGVFLADGSKRVGRTAEGGVLGMGGAIESRILLLVPVDHPSVQDLHGPVSQAKCHIVWRCGVDCHRGDRGREAKQHILDRQIEVVSSINQYSIV